MNRRHRVTHSPIRALKNEVTKAPRLYWSEVMNAYWIGTVVGAVLFAMLWSRLWLWLSKIVIKPDPARIFVAYALAFTSSVVLGAIGFAVGDAPVWGRALLIYTPAFALWLMIDLLAWRGRRSDAQAPAAEAHDT